MMDKFMEMAYEEALSGIAQGHGGPFGAVIVKDGKVIARGHNEVLLQNDPTAHGEVVAIRRACQALNTLHLPDCTLYTSAKPCPMCKGAIQWSRIKNVIYSGDYEDTKQLNFDDQDFSDCFCSEEESWRQIDQEHFKTLIQEFESHKKDIKY